MRSALLAIDVQQGLCEGDGKAFESAEVIARVNSVSAKARDAHMPVIAHHNATLTQISSFGPRVQAMRCSDFQFT